MTAVHEWLALMRVHEGGITTWDGQFFHHGQPVADYLADALVELLRTEHVAQGRATPNGQQVCVTSPDQAGHGAGAEAGQAWTMTEEMVDELVSSGHLSPDWRPSFLAVPREQFIPEPSGGRTPAGTAPTLVPLHRREHPAQWHELVSGPDFVITQVDDGHPAGPGDVGDQVTSSASMPKVVALMLRHLDIHGGERVLEIGTGTGWNAALLAHRIGAARVTSVEVDPQVATHARTALRAARFDEVTVVTADGALGYPPHAPYDRLIATPVRAAHLCGTRSRPPTPGGWTAADPAPTAGDSR